MTKARGFVVAFVILLLGIGLNSYLVLHQGRRLSRDEGQTCEIQNRGLKAQPHLVQVMAAINQFLKPPPKGETQPPTPPYLRYSIKAIRYHLPLWLALEQAQPSGRSC